MSSSTIVPSSGAAIDVWDLFTFAVGRGMRYRNCEPFAGGTDGPKDASTSWGFSVASTNDAKLEENESLRKACGLCEPEVLAVDASGPRRVASPATEDAARSSAASLVVDVASWGDSPGDAIVSTEGGGRLPQGSRVA